ncbi:hypothetical protein [Bacteriovorax sp. Seq25_V]|uniref:hypothetical protein n=1 Tax=Bacteriovorax sp. Seq25_V TaxID=1201288 RepID=UPI00038A1A9F|nr:hypothetical protein [Bacteriovorax sp. Seq25_V]EQC43518.1 putative lipoprotein [Bacteriovorax sp. Seq25_V]
MKYLFIVLFFMLSLASCFKNKSTWHGGVDSNDNGVRDDIESWIQTDFRGNQRLELAMMKLASVDPAACDYKYHIKCLGQVSEDALLLQLTLFERILDTEERREAFNQRIKNCPAIDDRNLNFKCEF